MPSYKPKYNVPRLRAYLQRRSGKRLLLMDRQVWDEIEKHQKGEFEVEVREFPMAEISRQTKVASIAKRIDDDVFELEIYREDLEDTKPINVDRFALHDNFYCRLDFQELVKQASTSDDENMQRFLNECVIIEIKEPGNNHHIYYDKVPDLIKYRFVD